MWAGVFWRILRISFTFAHPKSGYIIWIEHALPDKRNSLLKPFGICLLHRDFHFALISCHFNNLMQIPMICVSNLARCSVEHRMSRQLKIKYIPTPTFMPDWVSFKCTSSKMILMWYFFSGGGESSVFYIQENVNITTKTKL